MEEQGNQATEQLGDPTNPDSPAQALDNTETVDTSEASIPADLASLAKEVQRLNEHLLLLIEKSMVQKDTVATDSGVIALKITPEERNAAMKSASHFFAGIQINDLKAKMTISLFLAAFCTEGVGCYNKRAFQSQVIRDLWSLGKPAIVLRDTSIKAPACEWGPLYTFQDRLHSLPMHKEGIAELQLFLEGSDSDLEIKREVEKISAAWSSAWSEEGVKWTDRVLSVLITINDSGYPVSVTLPQQTSTRKERDELVRKYGSLEKVLSNPEGHEFEGLGCIRAWSHSAHFVPIPILAFILYQLDEPFTVEDGSDNSPWKDYLMRFTRPSQFALFFIKAFTSGLSQLRLLGDPIAYNDDWVRIHKHFRYLSFSVGKVQAVQWERRFSGIRCDRVRDTIYLPKSHPMGEFTVQECRYSIAVSARSGRVMPPFVVVILFDGQDPQLKTQVNRESWEITELKPSKHYTGVAVFQLILNRMIISWAAAWNATLTSLDNILQTELENMANNKNRQQLMIDNNPMETTALYFTILGILGIMDNWIRTSGNLAVYKGLWKTIKHQDEREAAIITSNWEILLSNHEKICTALRDRISRKTEEIKSLRDGLLNASNLLEAKRGGRINQSIFVFTVVTIFYLPLSFVGILFGMHLFDSEDPHKTQASFYISTVLVSLVTYALAGLAVWWVGKIDRQVGVGQHKVVGAAGLWRYPQTGIDNRNGNGPSNESPFSHLPPRDSPANGNFSLLQNLKNLRRRKQSNRDF